MFYEFIKTETNYKVMQFFNYYKLNCQNLKKYISVYLYIHIILGYNNIGFKGIKWLTKILMPNI
jgi:hypothetical protein